MRVSLRVAVVFGVVEADALPNDTLKDVVLDLVVVPELLVDAVGLRSTDWDADGVVDEDIVSERDADCDGLTVVDDDTLIDSDAVTLADVELVAAAEGDVDGVGESLLVYDVDVVRLALVVSEEEADNERDV